jgi:hypothetical protein
MRVAAIPALIAIFSVLPASAFAQPTTGSVVQEIVVEGRRSNFQVTRKFVNDITAEVRDKSGNFQIAKFADPVCPVVFGLNAAQNTGISERLLKDAKDAGLRTEGGRCDPNIVIIISEDGRQLLQKLHSAHPAIFGDMNWYDISLLLTENGPVHTWQLKEISDRGGQPLGVNPEGSRNYLVVKNYSPSIIEKSVRQRIDTSFLLIDSKAVDGLDLIQIADYAAMRTLAITRAPKAGAKDSNTILTLFDADQNSQRPEHLSTTDAAYLHALYSTSNVVSGTMQQANIVRLIKQAQTPPP